MPSVASNKWSVLSSGLSGLDIRAFPAAFVERRFADVVDAIPRIFLDVVPPCLARLLLCWRDDGPRALVPIVRPTLGFILRNLRSSP